LTRAPLELVGPRNLVWMAWRLVKCVIFIPLMLTVRDYASLRRLSSCIFSIIPLNAGIRSKFPVSSKNRVLRGFGHIIRSLEWEGFTKGLQCGLSRLEWSDLFPFACCPVFHFHYALLTGLCRICVSFPCFPCLKLGASDRGRSP
jgi:hypothetical protein